MIEIFGFVHTLKNIFVRTLNTRLHSSMSVTQLSKMGWTTDGCRVPGQSSDSVRCGRGSVRADL